MRKHVRLCLSHPQRTHATRPRAGAPNSPPPGTLPERLRPCVLTVHASGGSPSRLEKAWKKLRPLADSADPPNGVRSSGSAGAQGPRPWKLCSAPAPRWGRQGFWGSITHSLCQFVMDPYREDALRHPRSATGAAQFDGKAGRLRRLTLCACRSIPVPLPILAAATAAHMIRFRMCSSLRTASGASLRWSCARSARRRACVGLSEQLALRGRRSQGRVPLAPIRRCEAVPRSPQVSISDQKMPRVLRGSA